MKKIFILCIALLLSFSCTYPISKQLRSEAQKDNLEFPGVLADPSPSKGKTALWGGRIIEAINTKEGTDIIILETPLDFTGVPESAQSSRGRFIARSAKFLDPAVYSPEREITLAGEIAGAEERSLGNVTYRYPVVLVKELYLWEKYYPSTGWYSPWYGGPGPYYEPVYIYRNYYPSEHRR